MGAFFRLLSTPSHPFEDMPDPGGTIGDSKVLLDEAGHPGPGPEFISAAMGASTLVQEFDEPLLLVENGKALSGNLVKENMTMDELMSQIRQHGVGDISKVERVYIEGDGHVSVIKFPATQKPL